MGRDGPRRPPVCTCVAAIRTTRAAASPTCTRGGQWDDRLRASAPPALAVGYLRANSALKSPPGPLVSCDVLLLHASQAIEGIGARDTAVMSKTQKANRRQGGTYDGLRMPRSHRSATPPSQESATPPSHGSATPTTQSHTNRLAAETSPYLLQHAHNPVDWYPWGDEALDAAQGRGQADLPVDRLRGVPLVPRDGARVVRGRGDRARS